MKKRFYMLCCSLVIAACAPDKQEKQTTDSTQTLADAKVQLSPDERYGELFDSVQLSGIFPDSKTFADYTPKLPTDSILALYATERVKADFSLKTFIDTYFEAPLNPADNFQTDRSQSVEAHINRLWDVLARPADAPGKGTLIPLPHPYIVPGGRFREIYYWDSYFTMLGLQTSGRIDLITHMVDNFAHLINTVGFIPNGNRTYYLSRSQPPFFAAMVQLLADAKQDEQILVKYLPQLEKEYAFWMDGAHETPSQELYTHRRVVEQAGVVLNRYCDDRATPRPEGYREDIHTARASGREAAEVYRHLRSGAESGWDYSSRWFDDANKISTIRTADIIPVDLNALLYNLERTIARAKRTAGNENHAKQWEQKAQTRKDALMRYCWSESEGMFFDYDFRNGKQKRVISAAMAFPLFFQMVTPEQADRVAKNINKYLVKAGGVVTTTNRTGQQWDAPNGWAPLQWVSIQGLRNYGHEAVADTIANRWIRLNTKVFRATGKMLEKYDVENLSLESGGGEYPVQDGFGWTNGVLLKLLSEKNK
jgi:alpha,alpha-trehalase